MGTISKQLFISAPLEKVWRIWSDVEKTPDWVEGVKESKILSSVRAGKGLEWEEKCAMGGQIVQMQHEVREWEEKKKTAYYTKLPMGAVMETSAPMKLGSFKPSFCNCVPELSKTTSAFAASPRETATVTASPS